MATEILKGRLDAFRKSQERLKEARDAEFKIGRPARINSDRFHGFGLVVGDEACPLDQLAVRLENGNVWWYPLEDCHVAQRDACPSWLQAVLKKDSTVSVRALKQRTSVDDW